MGNKRGRPGLKLSQAKQSLGGDWSLILKVPSQPIPQERTGRSAEAGSQRVAVAQLITKHVPYNTPPLILGVTGCHNNARHCCTGVVAGGTVALVDSRLAVAGNSSLPAVADNNCSPVALGNHPSHDDCGRSGVPNRDAPGHVHAYPNHHRLQTQR